MEAEAAVVGVVGGGGCNGEEHGPRIGGGRPWKREREIFLSKEESLSDGREDDVSIYTVADPVIFSTGIATIDFFPRLSLEQVRFPLCVRAPGRLGFNFTAGRDLSERCAAGVQI